MTGSGLPLDGGNMSTGVVRVGDTVRRPSGPWTPAVHALLTHLHDVGFHGAPRPLGIDDRGREILTYLPGVVPWPGNFHLLDDGRKLRDVARLIREFHDAAAESPRRRARAGRRSSRPTATRSSPITAWHPGTSLPASAGLRSSTGTPPLPAPGSGISPTPSTDSCR